MSEGPAAEPRPKKTDEGAVAAARSALGRAVGIPEPSEVEPNDDEAAKPSATARDEAVMADLRELAGHDGVEDELEEASEEEAEVEEAEAVKAGELTEIPPQTLQALQRGQMPDPPEMSAKQHRMTFLVGAVLFAAVGVYILMSGTKQVFLYGLAATLLGLAGWILVYVIRSKPEAPMGRA